MKIARVIFEENPTTKLIHDDERQQLDLNDRDLYIYAGLDDADFEKKRQELVEYFRERQEFYDSDCDPDCELFGFHGELPSFPDFDRYFYLFVFKIMDDDGNIIGYYGFSDESCYTYKCFAFSDEVNGLDDLHIASFLTNRLSKVRNEQKKADHEENYDFVCSEEFTDGKARMASTGIRLKKASYNCRQTEFDEFVINNFIKSNSRGNEIPDKMTLE